jgi:hypothetical protein
VSQVLGGIDVEEGAGFVDVAHAEGGGAFFEERCEAVETLAGEGC